MFLLSVSEIIDTPTGTPVPLIAGSVGGGVCFILVIVVVVVMKRRDVFGKGTVVLELRLYDIKQY